ncbi:restriction endonuclease subunit S [Microbulbifer sp. TRSA001]|uniref:restriction endonuclease subunit S n=1 Tax=Microbulbifer sp. TRSA001 TaxID=3243381 RepID=UPI004039586C
MANDNLVYTVEELILSGALEKPLDGNHGDIHPKGSDFVDSGIPFIMASDMVDGQIDIIRCKFITNEQAKTLRKGFAKRGDVLLSHKATIGRTALVEDIETDFVMLTPQVTYYRVKDYSVLNNRYLKYYFDSAPFQSLFNLWAGGGSTRAYLGITGQRKLPIYVPAIEVQNQIVDVLSSLDKKIQLNRQTNQTLEQMAQALFKSWFVDFDPVIDNALAAGKPIPDALQARVQRRQQQLAKPDHKPLPEEFRQHFPCEFEHTEALGWVPKGWLAGKLQDLLILQRGFDLPKKNRTEGFYPLIASSGQDGFHGECKVNGPGLVTGRSGRIGVVTFVHGDFWPLNTTLWVKEYKNSSVYHGYFLLNSFDISRYAAGSAVPTLNRNHVHEHPCVVPPKKIVDVFDKFVVPLFQKIKLQQDLCDELTKLRDTLLPKLISGELRIPDVEKEVSDAVA